MQPLNFQKKAIDELVSTFKALWNQPQSQIPLVFKSPTGSGKTYMTSAFINEMVEQPDWNNDVCWIWITFSDDLAMQSRDKFGVYFKQNLKNQLLTVQDFNFGVLRKNDVLFLNWQKLVSRNAKDRLLRRPDDLNLAKENGYYFEDVIEATHKEGRTIILVVDESHKNMTEAAQKIVINPINPKIILKVSATPTEIPTPDDLDDLKAGYVKVKREDVVAEGLIKEKIVCQASDDIKKLGETDLDETLITLAINKKSELQNQFAKLNKNVNPLVLIQLPNDDNKLIDAGQETKEQIVLKILHKYGVDDNHIALWFDGKKVNMDFISDNDCEINYILFKEAAGTGWDCPRAHILVMFREINSPVFKTQTIGRILRMPEPEKKSDYVNYPELRAGYLYTNYDKNEVSAADWGDKNKPALFNAKPPQNYINYDFEGLLESDYLSRTDYGDFVSSAKFQECFLKSFDAYFGFEETDSVDVKQGKTVARNIEPDPVLNYYLITDSEFSNYDNLSLDIKNIDDKELLSHKMSQNDIEKLFNYHCIKILLVQTDEDTKIGNAARSWSPLKCALNVWFRTRLQWGGKESFVADMQKGDASIFADAIHKALKDFAPIRTQLLKDKKKDRTHNNYQFQIQKEYTYTDDYEEIKSEKSLLQPCYFRKEYTGKKNETAFVAFLDKLHDIEWWYKNGDHGQNNFGFEYVDSETGKDCLFYPDWIVMYTDGTVGIYDTKAGTTAEKAGDRAESLYKKLIDLNEKLEELRKNPPAEKELFSSDLPKIQRFVGGIVVQDNGGWYCNSSEKYEFTAGSLSSDWKRMI